MQNLQVVLFIDCLVFCCVFVMHYAAEIEETCQHHFDIAANFLSPPHFDLWMAC